MNFVEPIPSLPADVHDPFALLCSGRNFVRCWMSRGEDTPLEVVCVNQSGGAKPAAHLLKYDSILGTFDADVKVVDDETISVHGKNIAVVSDPDPLTLPSC